LKYSEIKDYIYVGLEVLTKAGYEDFYLLGYTAV
jgi:hypothetical protein